MKFFKFITVKLKSCFMFVLKRKYSHLTPRYVINRILQWNYYRLDRNLPWLNKSGNEYLQQIIQKNWYVVEFGGGGSTRFFLENVNKLITIEHNFDFFNKIKQNNNKFLETGKFTIHNLKTKDDFLNFISNIDKESLDMVLVDSIFRYSVTCKILDKIKVGGFLIIDNVNRFMPTKTYTPIDSDRKKNKFLNQDWENLFKEIIFKKYTTKITTDGISDTGFFMKKIN